MKARIYAGPVKKKHVCNLGFAEVCGMKFLICSAILLLSFNDNLGCSNIDYPAIRASCWFDEFSLSLIVRVGSSMKIDET